MKHKRMQNNVKIRLMVYIGAYWPIYSGQARHLQRRLKRLRQFGIEPWVLTQWYPGLLREQVVDEVRVRRIGFKGDSRLITILRELNTLAAFLCFQKQYDMVLLNGTRIAEIFGGPLIRIICSRPVVREMSLLGSDDPHAIINHRYMKYFRNAYRVANAFIANSPALVNAYRSAGWPTDKVHLLTYGVDVEEFKLIKGNDKKKILRKKLRLPDGNAIIWITIGAVIPRKGIHRLIEVWEKVHSRIPNAHLVIVGVKSRKNFEKHIINQIDSMHLSEYIHLLGNRKEVPELLGASDGFVLASESEGLPNSVLEAMASGIPPIVFDLPKITDHLIKSSATGIIVPQNDIETFTKAIINLSLDEELRLKIGKEARKFIQENFSLQKEISEHVEFYYQIFNKHRQVRDNHFKREILSDERYYRDT